jgi:hypothetical protein
MQLTYAVTFEDFRALQPPFATQAGKNLGFRAALVACVLTGLLGLWGWTRGLGVAFAGFLIGLGVLAAAFAWVYERHTVRKAKENYEKNLSTAYKNIHCRERRMFEATDEAFTASCRCGTVSRPWSELTGFGENKTHLSLSGSGGALILPKSAFRSEGEVTEFRALAASKLHHDRPTTSPHIEYRHTREDFRRAYLLHLLKGGGWRPLASSAAKFACIVYGTVALAHAMRPANRGMIFGPAIGVLLLRVVQLVGGRRKPYFGPLRIYFGDSGLYLQDPTSQSRRTWHQFLGYVEDNHAILLYITPRLYRIIPKRELAGQGVQLLTMIREKLKPYDYRHPAAGVEPDSAVAVQGVSRPGTAT